MRGPIHPPPILPISPPCLERPEGWMQEARTRKQRYPKRHASRPSVDWLEALPHSALAFRTALSIISGTTSGPDIPGSDGPTAQVYPFRDRERASAGNPPSSPGMQVGGMPAPRSRSGEVRLRPHLSFRGASPGITRARMLLGGCFVVIRPPPALLVQRLGHPPPLPRPVSSCAPRI